MTLKGAFALTTSTAKTIHTMLCAARGVRSSQHFSSGCLCQVQGEWTLVMLIEVGIHLIEFNYIPGIFFLFRIIIFETGSNAFTIHPAMV